ncbi:MAG: helix-turn-helix domain-containing protein [Sphingomonadales bacterium]|nr:helix-turn-helix domain-containing protein [Sphingomonadales bacterium]
MYFNSRQCKSARNLVGWTQQELADRADVGLKSIADFERGESQPTRRTMSALQRAFKKAGIIFIAEGEASRAAGEGVRMKKGR